MISLDCKPSSLLDWDLTDHAENSILWVLDFGLEAPYFPFDQEMHFEALSLAAQKFTTDVWPQFQEKSKGLVIYRGSAHFSQQFLWSERQRCAFLKWKEQMNAFSESHLEKLYCADVYVNYFQLLAHQLPDDVPVMLFCDAKDLGSPAEKHHILSKERFEHFQLITKNLPFSSGWIWEKPFRIEKVRPASVGLCFPEEEMCSQRVLERLDEQAQKIKGPLRMISERYLTEDWMELDTLHVLKDTLSSRGNRKLKGFCVTGGQIIDAV